MITYITVREKCKKIIQLRDVDWKGKNIKDATCLMIYFFAQIFI